MTTGTKKQKKTPRTYKPDNLTLDEWQIALRREFGREQRFRIENVGDDPVFSDFDVTNPATDGTYRVSIRGAAPGDNYCTCPDFSVNTLGTCKHIEFALARIERKGGKRKLAAGYRPAFSEIWLRYGAQRQVVLRRGSGWKEGFTCSIDQLISSDGTLCDDAIDRFEGFLTELRNAGNEVRCHDDALEFIAQRRDRNVLPIASTHCSPRASAARRSSTCSRSSFIPTSAAERSSLLVPDGRCSPTTWDSARRFRRSRGWRSSPGLWAFSAC